MYDNKIKIEFESKSQNEGFSRVAIAAFVSQLDPTIEEITDVKTAVSEAVTNSIIHGYENKKDGIVVIEAMLSGNDITIIISDNGKGIKDVSQAREPLFTSRPDLERSGMGFTVMETFMDSLQVESQEGRGTRVVLKKKFDSVS
ncbi:MAG: anti-sigma F factor [Clostridium sp.]|nr:anti-sigma F factor [Clostridium sp.]